MEFDFVKKFSGYSNKDLLRILNSASLYQPEAVEAARAILAGRQVTEEERQEAAGGLPGMAAAAKGPAVQEWQEGMSVFEEDEGMIDLEAFTRRWRYIIAAITGLQVAYSLYTWLSAPGRYGEGLPVLLSIDVLTLAGWILFLKGHRWGWILLGGRIVYLLLSFLVSIAINMYYRVYQPMGLNLILLTLNGALGWLLWMRELRQYFGIDRKTTVMTIWTAVAVSFICFALFWLSFQR